MKSFMRGNRDEEEKSEKIRNSVMYGNNPSSYISTTTSKPVSTSSEVEEKSSFKPNTATMGSLSERESIARKQEKERQERLKKINKEERNKKISAETQRLNEEQKAKGELPVSTLNNIKARTSAYGSEIGAKANNFKNKLENSGNPISKIPYLNTFHNTLQNTMMPDIKSTSTQEELDQATLKRIEQQEKILNDPNKSERAKEKARSYIEAQKGLLGKEAKSVKQQVNEQYVKDSEGHVGKSKVGNKVAEIGANLVGGFMPIPGMGNTTFNNVGSDVAKRGGMYAGRGISNPKYSKLAENFTKNAIEGGIGSVAQGMMNNEDPNQMLQNMAFNSVLGGALGGGLETYFDTKRIKAPNTNANSYGERSQTYDNAYKNAMKNPEDFREYPPSERERLTRMSAMERALAESSNYESMGNRPQGPTLPNIEDTLNQKRQSLNNARDFSTMDSMRREAIEQQPLALPMGGEEAKFREREAFANNPANAEYMNEINRRTKPMNQQPQNGASSPLNVDEFYRGASSPWDSGNQHTYLGENYFNGDMSGSSTRLNKDYFDSAEAMEENRALELEKLYSEMNEYPTTFLNRFRNSIYDDRDISRYSKESLNRKNAEETLKNIELDKHRSTRKIRDNQTMSYLDYYKQNGISPQEMYDRPINPLSKETENKFLKNKMGVDKYSQKYETGNMPPAYENTRPGASSPWDNPDVRQGARSDLPLENILGREPLSLPPASQEAIDNDMYRQRAEQMQREAQDFEANRQRFAQDMQSRTPDSRFMLPEANPNTLRAEATQRMYNDLEQQPLMLNAPSEATMYEERARKMYEEAQTNQALQEAQDEMDRMDYVIDDYIEGNGLSKKTDRRKIANMLGYDYDQITANVFQGKILDGYESPYGKPRGYYDEALTSHKPRNQMFQNESEPVVARKEIVRPRERDYTPYQDDVRLAPKQPNIQEDFPNPTGRRNVPYQDNIPVMNNMQGYNSPARNSRTGASSPLNIDEYYNGASSPLNVDEMYRGASSPLNVDEMYRGASSPLNVDEMYRGASSQLPKDFFSDFPDPMAQSSSRQRQFQGKDDIIQDRQRINRKPKQQSTPPGFELRFGEAPPRQRSEFEPRFSDGTIPSRRRSTQQASAGGNGTVGASATGGTERTSTNMGATSEPIYQDEAPKRKVNPRKPGETKFGRETVYKNPNVSDEVLDILEKSDLSYETHNNKKTLQKVNEDLKEGKLIDHANDLVNKFKDKKYNMTPYDYTKSQVVALQLSRDNEPERAAELFQLLSENAKTQGQLIQTLANFSKMTPEGALKFFDKQYKKASGKNDFIPKDLRDMVDSRIQDIANIEDTEKRAEEFAKLMRDFKDKTPRAKSKAIGDAWQSWNMISMLGNPKTMGRNILGNSIMGKVDDLSEQTFGRLVDKAMSLKTGKNTIASEFGSKAKQHRKESKDIAKKNSKKKAEWIKQGIDPTNLNMRAQGGTFKNKPMKSIEKMVNYGLNVPDEKSFSYAYEKSLRNQMRAMGVDEATEDMMEIANQEAMERTYKDNNVISRMSSGLQEALDKPMPNLKLGSKIIPFAKTPANVMKRGLEYTPLGIAEGIYKGAKGGNQRDVARLMGRGLTGTTALIPGAYLASKGLLQGELGGDTQEQNYRREMGEKANSLKLPTENGTLNVDISPLAPAITPLLTGANIQENIKQGMGKGGAVAKAIGDSTFGTLKEMPFVQGLNDFLGLLNGDMNMSEYLGGVASQSIPTLSGQVARFTDKTQADTSNDPNPITARIKAKVPGLSNTVANKINFLTGEEKKNSVFDNQLMRGLDIFLNPFNMSIQDNPKAEQYYDTVKEKGLDPTKYLPNRLKNNLSATKEYEAINLKGEDYKKYNQEYGKEINKLMDSYYRDPEAFQKALGTYMQGQTGKEKEYYKRDSTKKSKKKYKKGDVKQEARPEIEGLMEKIRREMSR